MAHVLPWTIETMPDIQRKDFCIFVNFMFNHKYTKQITRKKFIEYYPFNIEALSLAHVLPRTIETKLVWSQTMFCIFVNFMFNHTKIQKITQKSLSISPSK